jgi:hypothetical protein
LATFHFVRRPLRSDENARFLAVARSILLGYHPRRRGSSARILNLRDLGVF